MQKYKTVFRDKTINRQTKSDIQHCLRLNDLDDIGDGIHYLNFYMLGLYSFKHWSLSLGVNFWLTFLESINCLPDTVTIHPECQHHRYVYKDINVKIIEDSTNQWSDGDIGGYCTEFYKDGVEIGNIVVPLGESLDCGFGLERILSFVNNDNLCLKPGDVLNSTIETLISSGIQPSNTKQGYILRKLIRLALKSKVQLIEHPIILDESNKLNEIRFKLPKILEKYPNRDPQFYWDTFGIDISMI